MLVTGLSREKEKRSQQLMLNRIIARYERVIGREIARAMTEASRKLNKPMWKAEVRVNHAEKMARILTRLWNQAGKDASSRLFKLAKSLPKYEKKQEITTDVVNSAIADWIRGYAGEKITEITNTTMNDINRIIASSVTEGLSERETASLINQAAPNKGLSRSATIARTEAHGATQGISLEVAKESDIEMAKVWLTSVDDRTRGSGDEFDHTEADGQLVGMNDLFTVGGEKLLHPGDPGGSAGNVINCRCVVGYEII